MTRVVSKFQPLKRYNWGEACTGWVLADEEFLSVKQEEMPAGTAEKVHFHNHAHQFFYILKGRAVFEVEDVILNVAAGEGLQIEAGRKHRIINETNDVLEFIVCSQPSTNNDRITVDQL